MWSIIKRKMKGKTARKTRQKKRKKKKNIHLPWHPSAEPQQTRASLSPTSVPLFPIMHAVGGHFRWQRVCGFNPCPAAWSWPRRRLALWRVCGGGGCGRWWWWAVWINNHRQHKYLLVQSPLTSFNSWCEGWRWNWWNRDYNYLFCSGVCSHLFRPKQCSEIPYYTWTSCSGTERIHWWSPLVLR